MTRTSFIRSLKVTGMTIAIMLIAAFAIWRSLNYARGPQITISEPGDGSSITEKTVTIKGRVERAKDLLLNGNETNMDEDGNFSETIIIFRGINLITITARDQFDRSVDVRLNLVGNNNASSTSLAK